MPFPTRKVDNREDIPEFFENSQNIMEKATASNLIGLLTQLNDVSKYAAEIFQDILKTTDKNNSRIRDCKQRIKRIGDKTPAIEKMFVVNGPAYFYDFPFSGKEYRRQDPLRGLLFRRDRCEVEVNRVRAQAEPLPDLSALNKFAPEPCILRYSDRDFFLKEWMEAEKRKYEAKKAARAKRKAERAKRKQSKRSTTKKILKIDKKVYSEKGAEFQHEIKRDADTMIDVMEYKLSDDNKLKFANIAASSGKKRDKKKGPRPPSNPKSGGVPAAVANGPKPPSGHKGPRPPGGRKAEPQRGGGPPSFNPGRGGGGGGPPPVPLPGMGGGGGPPPFDPRSGGGGGPPPIPGMGGGPPQFVPGGGGGEGGPPRFVPGGILEEPEYEYEEEEEEEARPLSGAERAMLSSRMAEKQGAFKKKKPALPGQKSSALLSAIQNKRSRKLKKAVTVKREIKKDARTLLMEKLRNKSKAGLKHIDKKAIDQKKASEKKVEENSNIFQIMARRQFMADDDSESSGSSWGSDED